MCVNNENTTPKELEQFHSFVTTLDKERPLAQLLNTLGAMIAAGGSVCLGMSQEMAEQMGQQVEEPKALQPPPGIYAPGTFSAPEPGTGQYL